MPLPNTSIDLKEVFYATRNLSHYNSDLYDCPEDDSLDDDDADCICG